MNEKALSQQAPLPYPPNQDDCQPARRQLFEASTAGLTQQPSDKLAVNPIPVQQVLQIYQNIRSQSQPNPNLAPPILQQPHQDIVRFRAAKITEAASQRKLDRQVIEDLERMVELDADVIVSHSRGTDDSPC